MMHRHTSILGLAVFTNNTSPGIATIDVTQQRKTGAVVPRLELSKGTSYHHASFATWLPENCSTFLYLFH